jgi:hypothetical protein
MEERTRTHPIGSVSVDQTAGRVTPAASLGVSRVEPILGCTRISGSVKR